MNLKKVKVVLFICSLTSFIFIASCNFNVFDPVDNPSEDDELLSAARACLDQGDYVCAREYYARLSSNASDDMYSELAFTTLDEQGVGLSGILSALGSGNISGGKLFTLMANHIHDSASSDKRSAITGAFQKTQFIVGTELRGLVRFVTSMALLSHLMAEIRGNGGTIFFEKDDIVTDPTACINGGLAGCTGSCSARLTAGTTITDAFSSTAFTGTPNLSMISALISQISTALSSELSASGKFSSGSLTFTSQLSNPLYAPSTSPACFSYLLITNGLGDQ